jgi:hypothetical protein
MPVSLHVKAARFAQTDNTSLNQLINVAIAQYLGAREVTAAASTHSHSFYSAVSAPGVGVVGQGYVSEAVTLALEHLTLQSTSNSYVLLDNPSYIEHWPLARASIYPTPKREPFDIYFGGSHSVAPLKHG